MSDAALHGDWEYLAAYIEGGQEITLEMRPTIVAALDRKSELETRPRQGPALKAMAALLGWWKIN